MAFSWLAFLATFMEYLCDGYFLYGCWLVYKGQFSVQHFFVAIVLTAVYQGLRAGLKVAPIQIGECQQQNDAAV